MNLVINRSSLPSEKRGLFRSPQEMLKPPAVGGAWMSQSVESPALGFGSGPDIKCHDLMCHGIQPYALC